MGELTASIAHEVKQPLAAVAMNASAALNWIAGDKPNLDEARTALTRIVKGTDRATQIVDRIRAFMTRRQSITATVAMNDLIHEVLALTRHEVLKEHISLRTELAADLRDTVGDPVQLQQVMVNLIVNAIDAMRAQTADRRELLVCSRNDGPDEIIISVRDSGVGIEASRMDEMFAPFITTKPNGMGMGLAISRSIIEAHGGRIFAAPNPDRGATFRFSLSANGAISPP
jgi:C4-dicarboxylate-specific signal transduction histidine kinase